MIAVQDDPTYELERRLISIWSSVLGTHVCKHHSFVGLGGTSELAMDVIDVMRRSGFNATTRTLLEAPSLTAFVQRVCRDNGFVAVPQTRIPPESDTIEPGMLALSPLTSQEIERIIDEVPGGASNTQDIYPVSSTQEGIVFHSVLDPGTGFVHQSVFSFEDHPQLLTGIEALHEVIARHDILRTSVVWEGLTQPVQVVWRQALPIVEEVHIDTVHGDAASQLRARALDGPLIDLRSAPLMRLFTARDPRARKWFLLLARHPFTGDHATTKIIERELQLLLSGRRDALPTPVPYRNFVAQGMLSAAPDERVEFFQRLLHDIKEITAPFGFSTVGKPGSRTASVQRRVDDALLCRVRHCARAADTSPRTLFFLAFAILLAKVSRRHDVVFGTIVRGPEASEWQPGPFSHALPVRIQIGQGEIAMTVRKVDQLLAELHRHRHASLSLVQRCSRISPPQSLFNALLNYRYTRSDKDEAVYPDAEYSEGAGKYPLTLEIDESTVAMTMTVRVESRISSDRVCQSILDAVESLLDALARSPDRQIRELTLVSDTERHELLVQFNATSGSYRIDTCAHHLFEQEARGNEATALVCGEQHVTYRELNRRSNQLAHYFIERGVCAEVPVALFTTRSVNMIVGLLAILKAGGAYVPLDSRYPARRLAYMLEDARPAFILTDTVARARLEYMKCPHIVVDELTDVLARYSEEDPVGRVHPDNLMHIVYTSGSTGVPKGVETTHRAVVNRIHAQRLIEPTYDRQVCCQKTSLAFVDAVTEIFVPLTRGWLLIIADEKEAREPKELLSLLERARVTRLLTVPTLARYLIDISDAGRRLSHLVSWTLSGEVLSASLLNHLRTQLPTCRFINLYGSSETCGDATYYLDRGTDVLTVPIGRPIPGIMVYVLDELGELLPMGVIGELYLAGEGLSRGYRNNARLTTERFLPDPFASAPGARMYRTGDLVRWLPNGELEFIGRNDNQIKIRGFRIELGEIETLARLYPGVHDVVVSAEAKDSTGSREGVTDDLRLTAYYTCEHPADKARQQGAGIARADIAGGLRRHLAKFVPEYMVPSAYIEVGSFPLTPNGKVDREALRTSDGVQHRSSDHEAPKGETELEMSKLWSEVLGVDRIARNDDFFELGGHSLLALILVEKLQQAGFNIDLRSLLSHPTIAASAALLEGRKCTPNGGSRRQN